MKSYLKTTEKIEVNNYPYGSLKATAYFSLEFDKKKGFRSVFQTINPKTDRLNNPKKSTYSDIVVMFQDENNHIKNHHFNLNGAEELNKASKFMSENFDLFTPEQIEFIKLAMISSHIVNAKSYVIYCGSDFEQIKPLTTPIIIKLKESLKNGSNCFTECILDIEALEATKQPDYNPFKVTSYDINN